MVEIVIFEDWEVFWPQPKEKFILNKLRPKKLNWIESEFEFGQPNGYILNPLSLRKTLTPTRDVILKKKLKIFFSRHQVVKYLKLRSTENRKLHQDVVPGCFRKKSFLPICFHSTVEFRPLKSEFYRRPFIKFRQKISKNFFWLISKNHERQSLYSDQILNLRRFDYSEKS